MSENDPVDLNEFARKRESGDLVVSRAQRSLRIVIDDALSGVVRAGNKFSNTLEQIMGHGVARPSVIKQSPFNPEEEVEVYTDAEGGQRWMTEYMTPDRQQAVQAIEEQEARRDTPILSGHDSKSNKGSRLSRRSLLSILGKGAIALGLGTGAVVGVSQHAAESGNSPKATPFETSPSSPNSPIDTLHTSENSGAINITRDEIFDRVAREKEIPLKERLPEFRRILSTYIRQDNNNNFWNFVDRLEDLNSSELARLFSYDFSYDFETTNEDRNNVTRYSYPETYWLDLEESSPEEPYSHRGVKIHSYLGPRGIEERKIEFRIGADNQITIDSSGSSGYDYDQLQKMAEANIILPENLNWQIIKGTESSDQIWGLLAIHGDTTYKIDQSGKVEIIQGKLKVS